jgi:hypothetical protein
MKKLLLLCVLAACVPPHFDENPIPAKDAVFIPAGIVLDGGQQLLHVPPVVRFFLDIAVPLAVRVPSWNGRHIIDAGFDMVWGESLAAIVGGAIHGFKHPSHLSCYKYVGPDTAVTTPVQLRLINGQVWNGECLSRDEVRRLRHEQ